MASRTYDGHLTTLGMSSRMLGRVKPAYPDKRGVAGSSHACYVQPIYVPSLLILTRSLYDTVSVVDKKEQSRNRSRLPRFTFLIELVP